MEEARVMDSVVQECFAASSGLECSFSEPGGERVNRCSDPLDSEGIVEELEKGRMGELHHLL